MKFIFQLMGFALILLATYLLGKNIIFTTYASPYFWRGIAADVSILSLTAGVIGLFILPYTSKYLGWILILFGIICVFYSSRAVLNPTSLWQYFISISSFMGGFKLLTDRNLGG